MEWSFGDFLWAMVLFFFWFLFIWMFIGIFADIFRRNDLSGWGKAGWVFLIVILPFLGILIYLIVRPKMTEQDKQLMAEAESWRRGGISTADEIEKLAKLRDDGKITEVEFQSLKQKAMG